MTNVGDPGVEESEICGATRDDENLPKLTLLATDAQGDNRGSLSDEGMSHLFLSCIYRSVEGVVYFTRFLELMSSVHSAEKMNQSDLQPGAAVEGVVSREDCQSFSSVGDQEDGRLIIDEGI